MKAILEKVKNSSPLVHFITNYVTVNDVANMMLACGGSPIMSDEIADVEDITSICNATVINIGTLNQNTVRSMLAAGKKANALGHPVILDPVGAGASGFRTETTFKLLQEIKFSVIRGNISEIKTVYSGSGSTKGVDADVADAVTEDNLAETVKFAKELSRMTGAIIAITGAIDIIADTKEAYAVRNGVAAMSRITGTGCMLDGVIAGYLAANPDNGLNAVVAAVAAEGLCGELAEKKVREEGSGMSSFRMHLLDAMSNLDGAMLEAGARAERL
ncbi:MAG: hydroxyethylthiazole kinase [Bacteroidales bacterium]|nr:hydroxyethylthiazole kinase [Clostridium sp.]MCM1204496.1 hydroxyethylthiazole kinase [Bacteroidales bacterium]